MKVKSSYGRNRSAHIEQEIAKVEAELSNLANRRSQLLTDLTQLRRRLEELSAEHSWDYLEKQSQRIHQIPYEIDEDDKMEAFETWLEYLNIHLKLPFEPDVFESQERGPLHNGVRVALTGFEGLIDSYGILVNIKIESSANVFPLCDLKAANQKSTHYILTDDYAVWFANRSWS